MERLNENRHICIADVMQKVRGVQTACGLFRKVCGYSKVARNAALRDLLEAALFRYERVFTPSQDRQDRQAAADDLLLYMNRKHVSVYAA